MRTARRPRRRWRRGLAASRSFALLPLLAAAPAAAQIRIPAEYVDDWLIVRVTIGDSPDTLDFIVDTGAGQSAITEHAAARLGLRDMGEITASGASGTERVRRARVPGLRVGRFDAPAFTALVLRDGSLLPRERTHRTTAYDGVLGVDLFGSFDVLLDSPRGEMVLYDRDETIDEATSRRLSDPVAFRRIAGRLIQHPVRVNGVEVSAILDSGARRVILNARAAEAAAIEKGALEPNTSRGVGAQPVETWEIAIDSLGAGPARWSALEGGQADLPVFAALGLADGPAMLLGSPVLARCPVFISYRRSEVRYCRAPEG